MLKKPKGERNNGLKLSSIKRHKKNKSMRAGLNDDLKADFDVSGKARVNHFNKINSSNKICSTNRGPKKSSHMEECKNISVTLEPLDQNIRNKGSITVRKFKGAKKPKRSSVSVMIGENKPESDLVLPKIKGL